MTKVEQKLREKIARDIPTNWLDPLLTGPRKVITDNPTPKEVERLLRALHYRVQTGHD